MADFFPWTDGEPLDAAAINRMFGFIASTTFEQQNISATQSAGSTTFTGALDWFIIKNIGSDLVYFRFDGTATTSDETLEVGESKSFSGGSTGCTVIKHICDTGKTATIRVLGVR